MPRPKIATRSPNLERCVVHRLKCDRGCLEERRPLGRKPRGQTKRDAGRLVEGDRVRLAVRPGQVYERAGLEARHSRTDLLHTPDPFVADPHRVVVARVALDHETQLGIEALAPERRGPAPVLELRALADPTHERGGAHLAGARCSLRVLDELDRSRAGDDELTRHSRIPIASAGLS